MKKNLTLLLLLLLSLGGFSQEKNSIEQKYEMKRYTLVFLKAGPNRSQDSVTAAKIQEQHIAHLEKMAAEGKMDIAGPLLDKGEIRGICIYNVEDPKEAEKLANQDPAVIAGRLVVEVHPFYSAKGATLR